MAVFTWTYADKIAERSALGGLNLSRTTAYLTRAGLGPWLGTTAATGRTSLNARNLNLLLDAEIRFLEGDIHIIAQIRPAFWSGVTASTRHTSKEGFEDIAERTSPKVAIPALLRSAKSCLLVEGRMTKLVILSTLLGVAEHVVGFFDLLEPITCLGIIGVGIWMQLASQFAIRFLDLGFISPLAYPHNLIEIAFGHMVTSFERH